MAGEGESTLETVNTTGGDRFVRTLGPLPAQSEQEIRKSMLHSELSRLRRCSGDITIPESSRLDSPNYSIWSFRMKNILQREGLWRFVTTPPLWNMSIDEREIRSSTLNTLNLSLKDNVTKLVKRLEDPHITWQYLQNRYDKHDPQRKMTLLQRLLKIKKEDTVTMDDYLKDVRDIVDQLEDMGISLPEEITVLLILHSLPSSSYGMLVTSLTTFNLPSYDNLETKLINAEMTMALTDEKSTEALYVGSRNPKGKGKPRQTSRSTS
jgi:hypothetical protein